MMREQDDPWFIRLEGLNRDLEKIEKSSFKAAELPALQKARGELIGALSLQGDHNYARGMAASVYRDLYNNKEDEQRKWRNLPGNAGVKIAKFLHWKHLKSLNGLIDDALLADKLGEMLRYAMMARGCEPATGKYRDIVESLVGQPKRPQTLKEAEELVEARFKALSNGGPEDPAESEQRLVLRIVRHIKKYRSKSWQEGLTEIFRNAGRVLEDERAAARNQRTAMRAGGVASLKDPSPLCTPKPREDTLRNPRSSASIPRKPSTPPVAVSKHSHPWGDECLNTVRLLDPGPDGRLQGEFNRKLLYDILDDRQPKRYMVGEQLDLFDPGVDDKYFDEHMQVFLDAKWHTFGALTRHVDSLRGHIERWKHNHQGAGLPINFWPGVTIDSPDQLERMKILHGTPIQMFWVSFVGYRSERSEPLSYGGLVNVKKCSPQLLAFGWDLAQPDSKLTVRDARTLAELAMNRSICYDHFFTHPESRANFIMGAPQPEFAHSINSEGAGDELFAQAEALKALPRGWFSGSYRPKDPAFAQFKGDPVELFDYRP